MANRIIGTRFSSFLFASIAILSSSVMAIGPSYSGSWYYPEQDGHGFSFEYVVRKDGTPIVVAYWYVYDSDGNPIFMVGIGKVGDENAVTLSFQAPYGMRFGEFDPDDRVHQDGGIGRFEFENENSGIFSYEPTAWMVSNYGLSSITIPVVKLAGVTLKEPSDFDRFVETYVGSWSGRMTYDRRSTGTCHDADVRLDVVERLTGNNTASFPWDVSTTVIRDSGGIGISGDGRQYVTPSGFYNGEILVFGELIDVNMQFPPLNSRGHASGFWTYPAHSQDECYGEWIFQKD